MNKKKIWKWVKSYSYWLLVLIFFVAFLGPKIDVLAKAAFMCGAVGGIFFGISYRTRQLLSVMKTTNQFLEVLADHMGIRDKLVEIRAMRNQAGERPN